MSLAKLAQCFELPELTIQKKAKAEGWEREVKPVSSFSAPPAMPVEMADTPLATLPKDLQVADGFEALAKLQDIVLARHKAVIDLDMVYIDHLVKQLREDKRLTLIQRINAMKDVVKIRETLIDLERRAHRIVEAKEPDKPPVAVQVNVNISPAEAYQQMIKGGGV